MMNTMPIGQIFFSWYLLLKDPSSNSHFPSTYSYTYGNEQKLSVKYAALENLNSSKKKHYEFEQNQVENSRKERETRWNGYLINARIHHWKKWNTMYTNIGLGWNKSRTFQISRDCEILTEYLA